MMTSTAHTIRPVGGEINEKLFHELVNEVRERLRPCRAKAWVA